MGLDMYLEAEIYLSKFNEKEALQNEKIRMLFPEIKSTDNLDFTKVTFEAGYWRKASAIHNWFVQNCQDEKDDCGKYYVYREDLEKLKGICEIVLKDKSKAEGLLPSTNGFFFGSTDYDEWYFKNIEHTIEIINYCLSLPEKYDFYYHSSW